MIIVSLALVVGVVVVLGTKQNHNQFILNDQVRARRRTVTANAKETKQPHQHQGLEGQPLATKFSEACYERSDCGSNFMNVLVHVDQSMAYRVDLGRQQEHFEASDHVSTREEVETKTTTYTPIGRQIIIILILV